MTTAAKSRSSKGPLSRRRHKQLGQSMVEFAFLVPLVFGMLVVLREVEVAINSSIVNQKYARATIQYLSFNHRYYPETQFKTLDSKGTFSRRWWVGVEEKSNFQNEDEGTPVAPVVGIGRVKGADDGTPGSGDHIRSRKDVRIRSMAFICLPPYGGRIDQVFSEGGLSDSQFIGPNFRYCDD